MHNHSNWCIHTKKRIAQKYHFLGYMHFNHGWNTGSTIHSFIHSDKKRLGLWAFKHFNNLRVTFVQCWKQPMNHRNVSPFWSNFYSLTIFFYSYYCVSFCCCNCDCVTSWVQYFIEHEHNTIMSSFHSRFICFRFASLSFIWSVFWSYISKQELRMKDVQIYHWKFLWTVIVMSILLPKLFSLLTSLCIHCALGCIVFSTKNST